MISSTLIIFAVLSRPIVVAQNGGIQPAALVQALLALARSHGLPERIQAVGVNGVRVCELFRKAVREEASSSGGGAELQQGGVFKWVVFDRGADLLTPFMSQLTMEGRLDELQDIAPRCGWLPGERGAGAPLTFVRRAAVKAPKLTHSAYAPRPQNCLSLWRSLVFAGCA